MRFCPSCRTEYESTFELCTVCHVRLVDSLQDENGVSLGNELVVLAQFSNGSEAEMIREILETHEIQIIQRGEADPIGIASGAAPITLLVEEKNLSRARELYDIYFAGSGVDPFQPNEE
jgi:hypothetical protein